jgi:hypothetical protein
MLRYASHVACLHVLGACAGAQNPGSALNSNASSLPPLHLQSLRDSKYILERGYFLVWRILN